MSDVCPECGAALPSARPGSTVACPACRNPVLVSAARVPAARAPVAVERTGPSVPSRAAPASSSSPGSSWTIVGVALVVLAVAHIGLWLLLTASARSDVARAEERFAPEEMETALAEEERPATGDLRADLRRKELRETALAWETDRQHASMVGYALLGAFLLQAGILVMLMLRTGASRRPRGATPRR